MLSPLRSAWLVLGVATLLLSACANKHENYAMPSHTLPGAVFGTVAGSAAVATGATPPGAIIAAGAIAGGVISSIVGSRAGMQLRISNGGVQVITLGDTVTLVLPIDKFYLRGTDKLREDRHPTLVEIAKLLSSYEDIPITIAAYTDNVGAHEPNKTLSKRRANSLVSFFWSHGIDFHRLQAVGNGEIQTVASNATVAGNRMNRRIEIRFRTKT